MERESFIFYRSFYDSIKELPPQNQTDILLAICEYSLNQIEPEFDGMSKAIWILIKPQLDANIKRYENGKKGGRPKLKETKTKPKGNQKETKRKANKNVNVNDNDNVNEDIHPMWSYILDNYPNVSKLNAMTSGQCDKLKETYTHEQIIDVLDAMENHKGLTKKYVDCYKTVNNWLKRRAKTDKEDTPHNPFKYGVSL